MNEHKSSAANGDQSLDCSLDVPLLPDDRISAHPHLVNTPTEPLEALEPSAHTQVPGQLYGDYDSSIGDRDETAARVKSLGIDAPLYKSFRCIIPGHNHQARVHPTTAGFWEYRCEGITGGAGLGEVRAFVAYGCKRHLSSLEAARWRERLDYEAHLRSPGVARDRAQSIVAAIAEDPVALAELRAVIDTASSIVSGDTPLAYTVSTLAADLGVSTKTVRGAISRGELKAVKRGSRWFISAEAVRAWTNGEWGPTARPQRTGASKRPRCDGPSLRAVLCDPPDNRHPHNGKDGG